MGEGDGEESGVPSSSMSSSGITPPGGCAYALAIQLAASKALLIYFFAHILSVQSLPNYVVVIRFPQARFLSLLSFVASAQHAQRSRSHSGLNSQ